MEEKKPPCLQFCNENVLSSLSIARNECKETMPK